jgi:ferredoxin
MLQSRQRSQIGIVAAGIQANPHMSSPQRFSATIEPTGWTFDAPDATPLVAAARLAHIDLPASCRNGTCRTCMCKLASGQITYRIEWPGLTAEEKKDGFILPCIAYPASDVVIEVPLAKILHRN